MFITAAVLAEICSALPLSGSIYIWAAESAGPKRARFFGFLVAWWSTTAWMTFTAGNCQVRSFTPLCVARPPAVLTRLYYFIIIVKRQQRTTLCHSSPYGVSTFPVVLGTRTLDGEHSSGVSPKSCCSYPSRSITSRRNGTRACSASRSSSSCSIFSSASSGSRLPCTIRTDSVLQNSSLHRHVCINLFEGVFFWGGRAAIGCSLIV